MCVCPPLRLLITSDVMWCYMNLVYNWLNKFYSFYMAVTFDIISKGGL